MNARSTRHLLALHGLLAWAGVAACAQAAAGAAPPAAALRAQAEATGDAVLVGDVAELHGVSARDEQRLSRLVVAAAPRAGQVGRVNRAQLLAALPAGWVAEGAAVARVTRAVQALDGDRLCAAAAAAARARLESYGPSVQRSVDCVVEGGGAIDVPAGAQVLSVDVSRLQLVDGPQRANVDVAIAGRPERAVAVTLKLSLRAQQWCARTPVAAGEVLAAAAFAACLVPVRHPAQLEAAGAPLPAGRLRRALHADDVLAAADVVGSDAALAGDPVVVRLRVAGFELESRGSLVQDARIGDPVRVRISQATQPVIGHLTGERLVELENQP